MTANPQYRRVAERKEIHFFGHHDGRSFGRSD